MSSVTGIDVSHYNALANLGSQQFQFARSNYGTARDAKFLAHTANAKSSNVVAGAYIFGTGQGVTSQVTAFLDTVRPTGVKLLALDLEYNGSNTMSNSSGAAFIHAVHVNGYKIGLYHSRSGFPKLGQDWDWIADWDSDTFPPGSEFWQYQGNPIDRDKFNGTLAELRALAGLSTPLPLPRYRVIISGYTPLYAHPNGTRVGAVTRATYLCTRQKVSAEWWYRIISKADGSKTTNAGRYFKPNRHTEAHYA